MSPIQQMLLGVGAVATKTYVDDVFSTYLWRGNGSNSATRTMANGVDLAGEGGMVWIKQRTGTNEAKIVDTVRGLTGSSPYYVMPSETNAQGDRAWNWSFLNNGFSFNQDYGDINGSNEDYASWTFRKAPGFSDIVQITGDGTGAKAISHNLKSIPGLILVKTTGVTGNWFVYHRSVGFSNGLLLNDSYAAQFASPVSAVSDTTFTITNSINENGRTYICYLFAGGESTAATARSVDFDSSFPGDDLSLAASSDFQYGTGDFTWEAYVKPTDLSTSNRFILNHKTNAGNIGGLYINYSTHLLHYECGGGSGDNIVSDRKVHVGQWSHVAASRNSNVTKLFLNGLLVGTGTHDNYSFPQSKFFVGTDYGSHNNFEGEISNVRIIKGTGLYTSSFKPSTEPLTNVTNTKLLCCNNSSVTGSTVAPGTITATENPTASTDSPFDDPAGFVFGESGSENVIKCGSYKGSSSADFEVNLGWEPQWIMFKRTDGAANWSMFDSMRGIVTGGNENYLFPNLNNAEYSAERISLTPTGFIVDASAGVLINENNGDYIFVALRRPDGYVGKPPALGTGVFAMDTGNGSSSGPVYDSNFAVDWALWRQPASSQDWRVHARLTGDEELLTNSTAAEGSRGDDADDDFNDGWGRSTDGSYPRNSNYQSWMWKRHAGFDVVTYEGTGSDQAFSHSLSKNVEMAWIKKRDSAGSAERWVVFHKDLGTLAGNSSYPHAYQHNLTLNETWVADIATSRFGAPTSTHFTVKTHDTTNRDGSPYLMMLFASVSGISSVGSYSGSSSEKSVTTGFTPRFIIIRRTNSSGGNWMVLDSLRGLGSSGNDNFLFLESSSAQGVTSSNYINTTATGFVMPGNASSDINYASGEYIYYAHA